MPTVTVLFWVIKILTTGVGEAGSDFLGEANLVLAALVGVGGFALAMWLQFRAERYRAATYWFAVSMVAVFGTMVADTVHVVLGLPYWMTSLGYALAVCAVFAAWYRSEGTLSVHSIVTTRREVFYWTTVLATFALGTAVGDLTGLALHWGFLPAGILFVAAILVPLAAWRMGANPVACFWGAYVLTRPLGASFADWIAKPHNVGSGLGVGDGVVTALGAAAIAGLVLLARNSDDLDPRGPVGQSAPPAAAPTVSA